MVDKKYHYIIRVSEIRPPAYMKDSASVVERQMQDKCVFTCYRNSEFEDVES